MIDFPCTQCGACCRHVNLSNQTDFLDRGDGKCRYHDLTTHLCTIYENRPEVCRVDTYYEQHFKQKISWEQFVDLNLIACKQLDQLE
ncbi:YkgJ family cysteine cluster protein [Acinetobacter cumulans]|uniref:YkgJ family cysteine cluster protein n=1 Tax=Acinetobacter cumulans TaxID=2136182 RepID=A0ABX9U4G3_9GAMM|nr:YkgJ family cysteine cluster protein [Acinetobacter cumulans]RLL39818.1 YkgJ family cysteine cluster protein [Acinetobacter cumulans]